jgi:beta-glucosidase
VLVRNTGECAAAEVVQFYLSDLEASAPVPLQHLVGFERVFLQPGESRTLPFTLTPEMMSFFDEQGELQLEAGAFRLEVGGCSPGKRGLELGAPTPVTAAFRAF